jgi:hypothetical protein
MTGISILCGLREGVECVCERSFGGTSEENRSKSCVMFEKSEYWLAKESISIQLSEEKGIMISRNSDRYTWRHAVVLLMVLYVGMCVFNYTNAQKNSETSNTSSLLKDEIPDYRGLFDRGLTPVNYLKNGDFYSQDKSLRLSIDTSYIDHVDTAIWWYDKVLTEFPGTEEANEALRSKIRTLIGWEKGYGEDKENFGLHDRANAMKYFPLIESTFLELEIGFPDDEYLEAFAFQIAQRYLYHVLVYRRQDYKDNCKQWLEKTIELAKGKDTFYSHLSKLRLRLVR